MLLVSWLSPPKTSIPVKLVAQELANSAVLWSWEPSVVTKDTCQLQAAVLCVCAHGCFVNKNQGFK